MPNWVWALLLAIPFWAVIVLASYVVVNNKWPWEKFK